MGQGGRVTVRCWARRGGGRPGPVGRAALALVASLVALGVGAVPVHRAGAQAGTTVRAWGFEGDGELGNGETQYTIPPSPPSNLRTTPVAVKNLTNVTAVAAGYFHSVALRADGTVWAWGDNGYGQIGQGTTGGTFTVPVQVKGLPPVRAIAAGFYDTVVLSATGTVWQWGFDPYGPATPCSPSIRIFCNGNDSPVQVTGLPKVVSIATGGDTSLAVDATGHLWSWGLYLGRPSNSVQDSRTPGQVVGAGGAGTLAHVVMAAMGEAHGVALLADGRVWAWGDNSQAQLGQGNGNTQHYSPFPIPVPGLSGIKRLAANGFWSAAVESNDSVVVWGTHQLLQNGGGPVRTILQPTPAGVALPLGQVVTVSLGINDALAALRGGTVWAWGDNYYGELGDGTVTDRDTPEPVSGLTLTGTPAVAAGSDHSLAVGVSPPPGTNPPVYHAVPQPPPPPSQALQPVAPAAPGPGPAAGPSAAPAAAAHQSANPNSSPPAAPPAPPAPPPAPGVSGGGAPVGAPVAHGAPAGSPLAAHGVAAAPGVAPGVVAPAPPAAPAGVVAPAPPAAGAPGVVAPAPPGAPAQPAVPGVAERANPNAAPEIAMVAHSPADPPYAGGAAAVGAMGLAYAGAVTAWRRRRRALACPALSRRRWG